MNTQGGLAGDGVTRSANGLAIFMHLVERGHLLILLLTLECALPVQIHIVRMR